MLAIASTTKTDIATGPLLESISTMALELAAGAGTGVSVCRKKARVAAKIGVYLNFKTSRPGGSIQVVNLVRKASEVP